MRQVVKEIWEKIGTWMRPMSHKDCIISDGILGTPLGQSGGITQWQCYLPHYKKIIENVTETTLVWKCEAEDQKDQIEPWDSAWSVSILQKFQYMANTPWCIK